MLALVLALFKTFFSPWKAEVNSTFMNAQIILIKNSVNTSRNRKENVKGTREIRNLGTE